jgi:biopolymer transport protein ExbD
MSRRRRKGHAEHIEPDLPITPMLDMSFQLLAFFIMTFKPSPTEGQLAMQLPPPEQGGGAAMPDPFGDKPAKFIVRVSTNASGQIARMTLKEEGSASPPTDLGADLSRYMNALKQVLQQQKDRGAKLTKLTLELEGRLLQEYVVSLMDHALRAGFKDISPILASGGD